MLLTTQFRHKNGVLMLWHAKGRVVQLVFLLELCADELVVGGALGGLMTGGGGAPRIFHRRRRRRGFMVGGVGGARPDERAREQLTRCTGVFSGFTGDIHFTCDLC